MGLRAAGLMAVRSRFGSFGRTIAEEAGDQGAGENLPRNGQDIHSGAPEPEQSGGMKPDFTRQGSTLQTSDGEDDVAVAAEFIATTASHLARIAKHNQLDFIAYLIEMAVLEAWDVASETEKVPDDASADPGSDLGVDLGGRAAG